MAIVPPTSLVLTVNTEPAHYSTNQTKSLLPEVGKAALDLFVGRRTGTVLSIQRNHGHRHCLLYAEKQHCGSYPFKPLQAIPITNLRELPKRPLGTGESWRLPGNPGENQPNDGLSAIPVGCGLAHTLHSGSARERPAPRLKITEKGTPPEEKALCPSGLESCAPQAP